MTDQTTDQTAQTTAHFDAVAAKWARAAQRLDALTPRLVSRLGPLRPGSTLLDVACGSGEPGLSIAEANPGVQLAGIDIAPAMIEQAVREARGRGIAHARFEVASAEKLPVDDVSVDAVVSRMGMLGFPGSSVSSAHEAFRVLRPGGRLAIAVWDRPEYNTFGHATIAAHRHVAGVDTIDFSWVEELADGRRERWLRQGGFADVVSEPVPWTMHFADLDDLWGHAYELGPLATALATRDDAARTAAREHLAARLAEFRTVDGSYAIPVSGRILTAVRPTGASSVVSGPR
jgi:ubiquinone/menaquinone biosynthesis C-methylase UbiE